MNIDLWKIPKYLDEQLQQHSGTIITRFPPENSGMLHIGHAKALFINYVIARRYNGKLIVRFDDTNPVNESNDFTEGITQDIETLGILPDIVSYSSDYFSSTEKYAEELISKRYAYVDNTTQDKIAEQRKTKTASKNRDNSMELNLKLWRDMKGGSCLRLKVDMEHKNSTLRDPVIYRSIDKEHHRTGNTYKKYPTYDFACPVIDSIEGITHVFRSTEFSDRNEQYLTILDMLGLRRPMLNNYGKLNFEGAVLSKRKIKELIEKGIVEGWGDPKLLTIRGLLNRGIHIHALKQYIATTGFSKNMNKMTLEKLWVINKKFVDNISSRYTILDADYIVKVTVVDRNNENIDISHTKTILKYVKNKDLGSRQIYYSEHIYLSKNDWNMLNDSEEITLMNWGNMIVNKSKNELSLNLNGNAKHTKHKILWLPRYKNIKINISIYKGLYDPISTKVFIGELDLENVGEHNYVQFMKMNYYICTIKYNGITNVSEFTEL